MSQNEHGQPVGPDLGNWVPPAFPPLSTQHGRTVSLVPLDPAQHASQLFEIFAGVHDSLWTYMPIGPFRDAAQVEELIAKMVSEPGWQPYAVVVDGAAAGLLRYMRIEPSAGSIEIGSIVFAPGLSRTTAATEAIFRMIDYCFDLGYRRCEWKCDSLNGPSRAAAERFGFIYEGTFRLATHYKGRSRDTAWFAITIDDWPTLRQAFVAWLDPSNFDDDGQQRAPLSSFDKRPGVG